MLTLVVHRPRRTHSQTSPTNNYHFPMVRNKKNEILRSFKITKIEFCLFGISPDTRLRKKSKEFSHQTYICSLLQSLIKFINSIVGLAEVGMPSANIESAGNVKPLIVYKSPTLFIKRISSTAHLGSSLSTGCGPLIMCPGPPIPGWP